MKAPKNFTYYVEGLYYNIGVHNKFFLWDGFEYILSTRDRDEVATIHKKQLAHDAEVKRNAIIAEQDKKARLAKLQKDAKIAIKKATKTIFPAEVLEYVRGHGKSLIRAARHYKMTIVQIRKICKIQRSVER